MIFAQGATGYSVAGSSCTATASGFVRLESRDGTRSAEAQDIFIPPVALHGAMHGDLVLVEEDTPRADGRRSGRIARVLTRRNPTMVGIFHYARSAARRRWSDAQDTAFAIQGEFVQPLDDRMGGPIEVAGAADAVLPTNSAHRTLGDEARRYPATAQQGSSAEDNDGSTVDPSQSRWPLEGLAVEVEILQYAQGGRPARGRLLEVLGPPDAFGVDVEIVIRKHGIPHTFPAHVLEEADGSSTHTVASLAKDELVLRQDFRDLPVVTIDGETARDFDDAVLVRAMTNGSTELQVHIADVGWYVPAGVGAGYGGACPRYQRVLSRSRRSDAAARAFKRHVFPAPNTGSPCTQLRDGDRSAWRDRGVQGM